MPRASEAASIASGSEGGAVSIKPSAAKSRVQRKDLGRGVGGVGGFYTSKISKI